MKLTFGSLTATHFKSFDKLTLDLSGYRGGLHFLRGQNKLDPGLGSNGAGKSTLWDAVCWCLYGRTPSGLKTTDVRAWHSDKTPEVTLVVNGKTVKRSAGKLWIDTNVVGQEDVNRLVGLNADTFFHTVVLGQGQPLFLDLSPRDKMAKISTVLDLDRWDIRAEHAKAKMTRLEKLQARLGGEQGVMRTRHKFVDEELEQLQQRAEDWSRDQLKKLQKLEDELKDAQGRIGKLGAEHDKADLAYDGAMLDLRLLDKDDDRVVQQINAASLDWDRHDLQMAKLREERDQIEFDLSLVPGKCDKCGQPIGGKAREVMRNKMLDRFDDLEDELKKDRIGPALLLRVQELKQEEQRIRATAAGFRQNADKAKAMLDMTTPLLAELKALVNSHGKLEQDLKDAANPYAEQVAQRRRERKKLKADLEELEARLERLSGQIERTKFWVKGFRDVRLYVVDTLMAELEMATNAMLPEVGLLDWQVRYDIERTTKKGTTQRGINTLIFSPDNKSAVRWEAWSGGEGQRLRLIGALSFADVLLRHSGMQTNLEVLDEPTQHLSSQGVRDLVEFLQGRAKAYERTVFFIDHHAVESSLFDSVTTIVKDAHGSRVQPVLSTA